MSGKHVWKLGQTKYDLNTTPANTISSDPRLQDNVIISHRWSDYIHHAGSSYDYRSTVKEVLLQEDSDFQKDDRRASLQRSIPWNIDGHLDVERTNRSAQCSFMV